MAIAFEDFVGGNFVQVSEYCPWNSRSASGRRSQVADFFAGASGALPFLPFSLVPVEVTPDDGADCSVTVVGSAGIVAGILGNVAEAELAAGDTSDSCPASDSYSACSDSLECCWRNRSHGRCWASTGPSFDAVDSCASYVETGFHA